MSDKKIQDFYNEFHERKEHKVVDFMNDNRYFFLKRLLMDKNGKVLVVGCGSRDEMSILNNKCIGFGVDISKNAVKKSKKKYPHYSYQVADAQNLPFKDNMFDCVVCSEVIEHLPNDGLFVNEASRILKPNGILILTTPNWISWYGLARVIGERIFRKPFTSGDQPIDHWYTYSSLRNKVTSKFRLLQRWGLWFFPPFGKGKYMIPEILIYPVVRLLHPINVFLRKPLFYFGHMLAFELVNIKKK